LQELDHVIIADFEPSVTLHIRRQNNSLVQHGHVCHVVTQRLQLALPITLDGVALIKSEDLEENTDSNVRFCLARLGRKANIQAGLPIPSHEEMQTLF